MMLDSKTLPAPLIMVFVGVAIIAILYFPTLSVFNLRWSESSAFSHGYLLAPLSLWLITQEWLERRPPLNVELLPIILIAVVSFAWFAGRLVSVEFVEQSAVILLGALLIPALIGRKHSFHLLLPILFLFTTVPIIEKLVGGHLQTLTAIVSGVLLNMSGVRTFQDGYLLMVPAGSFVVEQSCSGIRYQIAAISLALIDGYISRMTWRYFIAYVVLAMLVAFVANSIRILIIVYVAQMTNMQTSLVDDHIWLGWVIFAVLMPVMMWLWHKYVAFGVLQSGALSEKSNQQIPLLKNKILFFVLLVALAFGPVLAFIFQQQRTDNGGFGDAPGYVIANTQWQETPADQAYWMPDILPPDISILKRFSFGEDWKRERVDVFSGYYAVQTNEREAINIVNKVFRKGTWLVLSKQKNVYIDGNAFMVEETVLRRGGSTDRLVWRWYNVGGKSVGNPTMAKIYNFISILEGRPDITMHIVATDIVEDKTMATEMLRTFVDLNKNMFTGWVGQVRAEPNNS